MTHTRSWKPGDDWRLARSLQVLREQINLDSPRRSKASDGSIADAAHLARGKSDHIPNAAGVVLAIDITNDPPHEAHMALVAEAIRASLDRRVAYMIFNGFMCRSYPKPGIPAWLWAPYTGPSDHRHHLHISVGANRADETQPWEIEL